MAREWDAAAYDRLPIPMTGWGLAVVDRLQLRGDERVLDAGCGTGQVTKALRDRLPRGSVVALDGSSAMIEQARERLGDDRVEYLVADLMEPLPVAMPVDAILSTATFHWVPDHDRLFTNLAAVLRPGGQLEAQCGGVGNIANVNRAARELGYDVEGDKVYAAPDETAARLERTGFADVRCWLHDEPTPLPPEVVPEYLRTVCLGKLLDGVPEPERNELSRAVAERLPAPAIDYVRLNISARRAG